VTEAAYTETIGSRTKVGDEQGSNRMALIDAVNGEIKYVDSGLKQAAPTQQKTEKTEPEERRTRLTMPQWSEDGTRAYITAIAGDNKDWWLFALDHTTGKTRVLATLHDDAWVHVRNSSGWMQNDNGIYFLSERDGFSHLYTVSWMGGEPLQLTAGRWEVFEAKLSRDKSRFFLETNEEHPGERHLYVMDPRDGVRRKLTHAAGAHDAEISPDGRRAATIYSYVNKPPELFVHDLDSGAAVTKVTDSPLPEFWSYAWQDAPIVAVTARDGVKVPGRLFKPRNARRGGPAVIFVHGAGYLQNIHKGWSNYYREYMFHHLLAERGYTVLDIDYRGSANYGRDWRTAIYRHMGGKDLEDHLDAAKWLASEHGVDPKRIGIYGGSYGGFITLMAMFRHPDVFAAGAALRPVTDWAHYNHPYTSNILNTPQADAEAYKRSSPIYFAEGLKGALLMCHGLVDVNVHAQDTIRLAQRLIELRKENWEMALYPVEDHAFVRPTSWADEYKRVLKLFDTNLKPAGGGAAAAPRRR
jgi:dipeptidyl aminopeptidase/acylaminoacyl peptidase